MIYKTKVFAALSKKEPFSDDDLIGACEELQSGLFDADLGGNVYKKRISKGNRGKSSGYRTIIGAVVGERYFFLYVFAKNKKSNVSIKEQFALKELAKTLFGLDQDSIEQLLNDGELIKVGEL
ncbi:type II toxin-antitoxin system RelE/ParE family toxin [Chrysiogenes arsenatis]|uniref:type II toxin-antitoxin system RelE/ParE family toxin n=1 Tax=Chrysiogenes arsenatis TaxID=309797 RepID=UPI0003FEF47B|nr:type II toxin-antitoxin system RelE/ParE family toxin [Chrysiogenes arsenatis]